MPWATEESQSRTPLKAGRALERGELWEERERQEIRQERPGRRHRRCWAKKSEATAGGPGMLHKKFLFVIQLIKRLFPFYGWERNKV